MKPSHLAALRRLLGTRQVSADPAVLDEHASDAWFASHRPEIVVFARNARDVSRLMRFASRHRIPVTARGSGRGYVGGCVPAHGGIVLSLTRMNRIKEISVADSVAVVEPCVLTADAQDAAKQKKLFYPPDPASFKTTSIGGNIATNAGGPRCLKYGVTRHYVLGLQVVLPNGDIVRLGGRVLKNKTGFDLIGLLTGSEGMLGIVTEATLRLIPYPPARAVLVGTFARARQATQMVAAIQTAGLLPAALEIADAFTLRAARAYTPNVPPGNAFVLVEIDGQKKSLPNEIRLLARLFRQCGALKIIRAQTENACEQLWNMRRAFSESLKATGLKKMNEDIVVPRGRLLDLFAFVENLQKKSGIPIACFGHAGDGNIHVNIMIAENSSRQRRIHRKLLDRLFSQVLAWGGAITGEHGIGIAKKRWWHQATTPQLRALHLTIKNALDPHHLLNPGKFLPSKK